MIMEAASTSSASAHDCHPNVPVNDWKHRPVFLKPGATTKVANLGENEALPMGVPFDFESTLFIGKMLVRFRDTPSDHAESHENYFAGRNRVTQTVIQGRFKRPIGMDDLFVGGIFSKPIKFAPPPFFMGLLKMLFHRVAPGAILDLTSETPKVLSLYAGSTQTMSIRDPGQEPDVMAKDIVEDVTKTFGGKFKGSSKARKRKLRKPAKAAKHQFDTEHVYTLEVYDESMNYGANSITLPIYGPFDLSKVVGPQPMPLSAVTGDGEIMYNIHVWHEHTLHPGSITDNDRYLAGLPEL